MTVNEAVTALLEGRVIYVQFEMEQWSGEYFDTLEEHLGRPVRRQRAFSSTHQLFMVWIDTKEKNRVR